MVMAALLDPRLLGELGERARHSMDCDNRRLGGLIPGTCPSDHAVGAKGRVCCNHRHPPALVKGDALTRPRKVARSVPPTRTSAHFPAAAPRDTRCWRSRLQGLLFRGESMASPEELAAGGSRPLATGLPARRFRRNDGTRSFYVRVAGRLWTDRRAAGIFTISTLVAAVAHGAVALCAGLLVHALVGDLHGAQGTVPRAGAWLGPLGGTNGPVGSALSPGWVGRESVLDWAGRLGPRLVCYVGLGLAVVKASASSIAAWSQHLLAARFGDHVRARVAKRLRDRGATGVPASPHSRIAGSMGICASKGTPANSATRWPPPAPKSSWRLLQPSQTK